MSANKSKAAGFIRRNGAALLLTGGLFALMYLLVFRFRTGEENYDYLAHMLWAFAMTPGQMLSSFYDGSERLWHVCVKLLNMCGVSNLWVCASLVTAAAEAASYFIIYKSLELLWPEKPPRWVLAVFTAAVFLVNSLTLPGGLIHLTEEFTRGAVNTWHNPTAIMVRPFAAAVFYMTVRIYNRRRYGVSGILPEDAEGRGFALEGGFMAQLRRPVYTKAELVLYPLCILLSAYAKPSFLQYFAPAILIFLLIDVIRTKGKVLPFCLKLALAYLPAAVIILAQFSSFFPGGTGVSQTGAEAGTAEAASVVIYYVQTSFESVGDFFAKTGIEWWRTVCLCAFPLFIFAVDFRRSRHSAAFRLGFIGVVTGRLESMLLHETGARANHFNFYWGYYVAVWLFWSVAMARYVRLLEERSAAGRLARWGGSALLLWHLTVGIVYLVHLFQTGNYFY